MKYGLFKRRWSLSLWSMSLAQWTVACMAKFRPVLLFCNRRDKLKIPMSENINQHKCSLSLNGMRCSGSSTHWIHMLSIIVK